MVRALVIEDSPGDGELLRVVLARAGVRVDLVRTLRDALSRVRPSFLRSTYDAIVADLHLPDASGADVVEAIRKADPHARVVAVSGTHDELIARAAIRAGARRFISKDGDAVATLGELVTRWAGLRRKSTPALMRALRSTTE